VKRTLHGTYIAPRAFHHNAYLDESVFRFNNRQLPDGSRLEEALQGVHGRRVTYAQLTATHKLWRLCPGRVRDPSCVGTSVPRTRCRTTRHDESGTESASGDHSQA
jgi:hypothetical protein